MKEDQKSENIAKAYESKKRMKKLEGISETKTKLNPEFKVMVDKMVKGLNDIADEIERRRSRNDTLT